MMPETVYDVAIIGGGPAGQAAALRTLESGLTTCMIDEQQRPGGQILRQPPSAFAVDHWMASSLYRPLRDQLASIEAQDGLEWIGGTSVAGLWCEEDGWRLHLTGQRSGPLRARRVLVATGCYDMPVALPGWTLPGAMSAGAVQTLLKGQQVVAGSRILLFGSHPLQLVLAEQLVAAGAEIAGIVFPQSRSRMARAALPHLPGSLRTPKALLAATGAMASLRRHRVPIHYGARVTRLIAGDGGTLAHAEIEENGHTRSIACDIAAQCFGFLPQSDLPRQAGAATRWSTPAGGWETLHDPWMRASLPGLYVAGETTGVTGADAAMLEGMIAGVAMALDAGRTGRVIAEADHARLRSERARLQPFIALLRAVADPRPWLPVPAPDTLLCRCEDISTATVDETIAALSTMGPDFGASAVKHRCRAGMGLCQGRSCEHAIIRRIATARNCPPHQVDGFRVRFPVRPIPLDEIVE